FLHLTRQYKRIASKVLIEGIETAGDFALARASVADYGQGYLWGMK
ncbi:EAL domain-containing protein, partial [Enterobacter asburiae]